MSCHTWFYRKIERTQEEANESCLKSLKKSRKLCWKIFKNPTGYRGINWEEDCGSTREECAKRLMVLNRKIKAIYSGYYQRAVWNHQDDDEITIYIEGKGLYVEDTGYHDAFRLGGYPDDKLFSYEETIKYLEDKDSEIRYGSTARLHSEIPMINGLVNGEPPVWYEVDRESCKAESIETIRKFWNEFPDGMIEFG